RGRELRAAVAGMARKDEVRNGRQDLEAQLGEAAHQRFAVRDDACARLRKPRVVLDRRDRAGDGEAIEGIGVEAVLHPLQRLDQGPLADGKAYAQPGECPRLGESLDDEQIVVARDERYGAFAAEVDVSLVDDHELVWMFGRQRLDRVARKPDAS